VKFEKYKIVQNNLKNFLFSFTKFCYLRKKNLKKFQHFFQIVEFSVENAQSLIADPQIIIIIIIFRFFFSEFFLFYFFLGAERE
jgi:hypothetical protein